MHSNPYKILEGQFVLHETIGSGGFAKVKVATHILTGEKVAIKIMDKKSLGDDLPRVASEVRALKELSHQNICRLYQVLDTPEKVFLILEHCSGGELFDYIVKKDRLPEPEARHFFRQIIAALAFVHSKGYAHRDLKPENLLLTEDLQMKLIDFGLCAKPDNGLAWGLETCCGSPAYAAPELLSGNTYFGNEADIWSLGVLLYALLCGFLPFEDDNLQAMYKKIQSGVYEEPPWLSEGSRNILKIMLQTNPKRRAKIEDLLVHPWIVRDYNLPLKWRSIYDPVILDRDCILEMALYYEVTVDDMLKLVQEWKYDETSCTYFLLLYKKRHNKPMILSPAPRKICSEMKASRIAIVRSPTIHGSLEFDLNKAGYKEGTNGESNMRTKLTNNISCGTPDSIFLKVNSHVGKTSYLRALANEESMTPLLTRRNVTKAKAKEPSKDNENVCVNGQEMAIDDGSKCGPDDSEVPASNGAPEWCPVAVYATPVGPKVRKVPLANVETFIDGEHSTLFGSQLRQHINGETENDQFASPASDTPRGPGRSPRSKSKGQALPRRVFNSVERQVDRVITALTPKRYRAGGTPVKLRHTKTLVNVSTTSSKSPDQVLHELLRIFEDKGIVCKQREWTIRGRAKDKDGRSTLTFELEVVYIDRLNMVGIRRKRLNGPSFMYKKICEDILSLAGL